MPLNLLFQKKNNSEGKQLEPEAEGSWALRDLFHCVSGEEIWLMTRDIESRWTSQQMGLDLYFRRLKGLRLKPVAI